MKHTTMRYRILGIHVQIWYIGSSQTPQQIYKYEILDSFIQSCKQGQSCKKGQPSQLLNPKSLNEPIQFNLIKQKDCGLRYFSNW